MAVETEEFRLFLNHIPIANRSVVDLDVEPDSINRVGVHNSRRDFADVMPEVDRLSQTFGPKVPVEELQGFDSTREPVQIDDLHCAGFARRDGSER